MKASQKYHMWIIGPALPRQAGNSRKAGETVAMSRLQHIAFNLPHIRRL
jgi:hypothetical protein